MKPKLDKQFDAAESASVPFAIILGQDEQAAGKVKIKEMGLPAGHPEKDGVLVEIKELTSEVKKRLALKAGTTGELVDLIGRTTGLSVEKDQAEPTVES